MKCFLLLFLGLRCVCVGVYVAVCVAVCGPPSSREICQAREGTAIRFASHFALCTATQHCAINRLMTWGEGVSSPGNTPTTRLNYLNYFYIILESALLTRHLRRPSRYCFNTFVRCVKSVRECGKCL